MQLHVRPLNTRLNLVKVLVILAQPATTVLEQQLTQFLALVDTGAWMVYLSPPHVQLEPTELTPC
jgi:hypothetical protein